ncbi:MAG: hypothetical protein NTW46_03515 [Candidatus Nealsonbacteria bacterium]|nr:hypothetical protein [Candidatus Nealsonbacteria bacterium]
MKYKLIYCSIDLTVGEDNNNTFEHICYFYRVKNDDKAIERAKTFIRKANWFEHCTGDIALCYPKQLMRVVKFNNGQEELASVIVNW